MCSMQIVAFTNFTLLTCTKHSSQMALHNTCQHLNLFGCRLPEESARFYAAEVLLTLEYLHKQNIIYRDLKVHHVWFEC